MNMNIIVCLGGFHQLMSFLSSIECAMEGSGLQNALETVYVPISVGHMSTGEAEKYWIIKYQVFLNI